MQKKVIIFIVISLTCLNCFRFFLNENVNDILPDGNYTSTIKIMSNEQEHYADELIMLSVINDAFSLHIQRNNESESKACTRSDKYMKGTLKFTQNKVIFDFTKVVSQQLSSHCIEDESLTELLNAYSNQSIKYRLIYQSGHIYCFESQAFGGICLNKE